MAKSLAFGALHLVIAFSVGYAFTGSLAIAGAMTLVEPLVNVVAHYFFDRWWDARAARRASQGPAHPDDAVRQSAPTAPANLPAAVAVPS